MSAGEIRVTSASGARKGTKPERYDLIPAEPLRLLAEHYGKGAEKYTERDEEGNVTHDGANNWRLGYDWGLSFAALMRHAWQFWAGEDIDPETGTSHTVAMMWHAATLTEFMATHPEYDSRPKAVNGAEAAETTRKPASSVSVIVGGDNPAMDEAAATAAMDALGVDLETRKDLVERAKKAAQDYGGIFGTGPGGGGAHGGLTWNLGCYYRGGSIG